VRKCLDDDVPPLEERDLPKLPDGLPFFSYGARVRCISNASGGDDPRYQVGQVYVVDRQSGATLTVLLGDGETASGPVDEFEAVSDQP
jgi:hypothetical protein